MSDTKGDGFGKEVPEFGPRPGSRHFGAKAQTPARADFKKWARLDRWHIAEGAMLILGFEPFEITTDWLPWAKTTVPDFAHIYEAVQRSDGLTVGGWLSPRDFLAWAREKEFHIPEDLEEAVSRFHPKAEGTLKREATQSMASEAPLHGSERDSLLKMILGMAMSAYKYTPGVARNTATGENRGSISADLQQLGLTLDADTVRKLIKEAETRFKDLLANPHKT